MEMLWTVRMCQHHHGSPSESRERDTCISFLCVRAFLLQHTRHDNSMVWRLGNGGGRRTPPQRARLFPRRLSFCPRSRLRSKTA